MRVFLDANILFAIANRPSGHLSQLLTSDSLVFVSSDYAFQEAAENLAAYNEGALDALHAVEHQIETTDRISPLPSWVVSDVEDRQILAAAIGSACDVLISYDRDFDALFGTIVEGVSIEHATTFIRKHLPTESVDGS